MFSLTTICSILRIYVFILVSSMMRICRHGEGPNCPDCYMFELEDLRKLLTHPNAQHILKRTLREGVIRRIDLSLKKFKEAEINEIDRVKARARADNESARRVSGNIHPVPLPYRGSTSSTSRSQPHYVSEFVTYSPPPGYMSPPPPGDTYIVYSPHHEGRHSMPARRYSPTSHPYSPYSPHLLRSGGHAQNAVYESDEEFFSAQSAVPRNRFQPSVVRGSAFGHHAAEPSTSILTTDTYNGSVSHGGVSISRPPSKHMRWSDDEVATLLEAYSRHGPRWERIRSFYPNLSRFTGQQLKDKHRTL